MTPEQNQLINDCSLVLQLKNHPSWQVIERDARENFNAISQTWYEIPEDQPLKLREARSRQLANSIILNLMDLYQDRLDGVTREIMEKESDLILTGDVDTNPPDLKDTEDTGEMNYGQ